MDKLGQDANQTDSDDESALPGLDVNIARASLDGIHHEIVYESTDFHLGVVGD